MLDEYLIKYRIE